MSEDRPEHDDCIPLPQAVPGWKECFSRETLDKVASGIAIEQERLRGSRFLVVLRRHELCYDGLCGWVEIVSGHVDVESAVAAAQIIGAQRLVELGRSLDPERKWIHGKPEGRMIAPWPKTPSTFEGKRLPLFADRLWDGVGWNAAEVNVAIIPTDPDNPINLAVIETIDMSFETVSWFCDVAEKPADCS